MDTKEDRIDRLYKQLHAAADYGLDSPEYVTVLGQLRELQKQEAERIAQHIDSQTLNIEETHRLMDRADDLISRYEGIAMGYLHIENLYKNQTILLFRECYALEKIHGTSAHVGWHGGQLVLSSGGESRDRFCALFDQSVLAECFKVIGHPSVVVYGEAYGGKQQKQTWRYGPELRFVAFDVRIGDKWIDVPAAADLVTQLGLEFVHFAKVSTDLVALDAERDAPSEQARRNGVENAVPREGVVLRPVTEMIVGRWDARVIAKHKRDEERETASPREVVDPAQFELLTKADAIADEWVTPVRLQHVLDKLDGEKDMKLVPRLIEAMVEDVTREASGEILDSKEARRAIGRRAVELYKTYLQSQIDRDP